MKTNKNWLSVGLALVITVVGAVQSVAVTKELPETEDWKSLQVYFEQKRSVGKHIVEKIQKEQRNVSLDSKDFVVSLYHDKIGSLSKEVERYNLDLVIDRETSDPVDKLIGRKTPRYMINISDSKGLPGTVQYTMKKTSFYPETTVDLYALSDKDEKQDLLMTSIPVDKDGNITFEIQNAGRYLIVGKTNQSAANPYDYERPQLFSIEELVGETTFFVK